MSLTKLQKEYLLSCNHRWNIKTGATGSGKSWIDYAYVIPKRIICTRGEGAIVLMGNTRGTLSRNVLDPMRDIWGEALVSGVRADSTADLFGKRVHVLGADNKKHVARIQGMTIEYGYGDEITTWAEEVFQMLKSRLRCNHSRFDGTCNPDNPNHWFKKFLDSESLDIFCQKSTIDDNPHLPIAFIENLKREYMGTVYYQRYILGEWAVADGIIYQQFADSVASSDNRFLWDRKINEKPFDIDKNPFMKICIGVDFGGNGSAHSFVATGFLPGYKGVIGLLSYRIDARGTTPDGLNKQFEEFCLSVLSGYGRIDAIYCDSAEQVLIRGMAAHLKKAQLPFLAVKIHNAAKTEINDRIRLTSILLGGGRLFYTPEAETLKQALSAAMWDSKYTDKDVRLDNGTTDIDTLDAFEYTIEQDAYRFIKRG